MVDINQYAPRSGRLIKEDNTIVNEANGINADGSRNVQLTGSNFEQALGSNLPPKAILMGLSDGTNIQAMKGNTEGTLLASATRTGTISSPIQTNYNARGVIITLNVTANPGGTETLTLRLYIPDPVSGSGSYHAIEFPIQAATNGIYRLYIGPGVSATPDANSTFNKFRAMSLPRTWLVQVVHSGTGAWTYSVAYQYTV